MTPTRRPVRRLHTRIVSSLIATVILGGVLVGVEMMNPASAAPVLSLSPTVTAKVTGVTTGLNIRSGPSKTSSITGSLKNDAKIAITGYTTDGWLGMQTSDGRTGYVSADYVNVPVVSIALASMKGKANADQTVTAAYAIYPACATDQTVTWSSSDKLVATVSNLGEVTGHNAGQAVITVHTADGDKTSSAVYIVSGTAVAVKGVGLSQAPAMLSGKTAQLTATVTPSNATNKAVTWTTGNGDGASISSTGLITAKLSGVGKSTTVTMTVRTVDGGQTASQPVMIYTREDVQTRLNALGCVGSDGKALSVDGQLGAKSVAALGAFQKAAKLTVSGLVDTPTLTNLFSSTATACSSEGSAVTPTPPPRPKPPPSPKPKPSKGLDLTGFHYKWKGPYVTQAFLNKVRVISGKLGANPDDLMAVMASESGLSPRAVNASSQATGLIQFMPATARFLGTSVTALRQMTAVKQLDYVYKFLSFYKGRLGTLSRVTTALVWPSALGKPDNYALFYRGSAAYAGNVGLDLNHDGKVTVGEVAQRDASVRARYGRI